MGAFQSIRTRRLSHHERWLRATRSETAFWADWLAQRGYGGDDYRFRTDPAHEVHQPELRDLIEALPGEEVEILDVGAGPLTAVGKTYPRKRLEIVAVDPLADQYDKLLAHEGIRPPVRTQPCSGEELLERFAPNSFDIATAFNALDHSYDPVQAIRNMVEVVRPGGFVLLVHGINEGVQRRYVGLHQWNFEYRQGQLVVWRRGEQHDLSETPGVVSGFGGVTTLWAAAPPLLAKEEARAPPQHAQRREAGATREEAVPRRGDHALARREVVEAEPAAEPLALPVERRQRVGQLPHGNGAVSDRGQHLPRGRAAQEVDEHPHRRHAGVVEHDEPAELDLPGQVPPVEHRIREPVGAVDQREVERPRLPCREHLVREADVEAEPLARDPEPCALGPDRLVLGRRGADGLVLGAARSEHDRDRAGAVSSGHARASRSDRSTSSRTLESPPLELAALAVDRGRVGPQP